MIKLVLKRSLAKAGIYATILSVVVASGLDYLSWRSCMEFPSMHFNVFGAVAMYFVLEFFNFIGIGVFQIVKNAIKYTAQSPVPETEE